MATRWPRTKKIVAGWFYFTTVVGLVQGISAGCDRMYEQGSFQLHVLAGYSIGGLVWGAERSVLIPAFSPLIAYACWNHGHRDWLDLVKIVAVFPGL